MISICFPTDFMTFILQNPRNSMTSAPNQTKPNQHIMADDFRTLNYNRSGTISPGGIEADFVFTLQADPVLIVLSVMIFLFFL